MTVPLSERILRPDASKSCTARCWRCWLAILERPPQLAPHHLTIHMFEIVKHRVGCTVQLLPVSFPQTTKTPSFSSLEGSAYLDEAP
jgi:hypothetical protein